MVLFPDSRSIALIISVSAFHLCCKFLVHVTVIDVLLFGDLVQSIDARISSLKSFCQMRARSHVLIAGPVKFDAGLVQRLLKVETPFALTFGASAGLPGSSPSPCHTRVVVWMGNPNLPNLLAPFRLLSAWPWGINQVFALRTLPYRYFISALSTHTYFIA